MQLITRPENYVQHCQAKHSLYNWKHQRPVQQRRAVYNSSRVEKNCVRHVLGIERQYSQIDIGVDSGPKDRLRGRIQRFRQCKGRLSFADLYLPK